MITYKNKNYNTREYKQYLVSTEDLDAELAKDGYTGEAGLIDDQIFYYVSAAQIKMSDKDFNKLMKEV